MEIEKEIPLSGTRDEAVAASANAEVEGSRASRAAHDDWIRARAYELYCERGRQGGDDLSDWLRAEAECGEHLHETSRAGLVA